MGRVGSGVDACDSCVTVACVFGNLVHVPCVHRTLRVCDMVDTCAYALSCGMVDKCSCALCHHLYGCVGKCCVTRVEVLYCLWVRDERVVPVCADVLFTILNSKFTHRLSMNDRVRASRVRVRSTRARSCTGVMLECKGVLLGMENLICKVPVDGCSRLE